VSVSPGAVLPVIGTKELVAWLPTLVGCGAGDVVVYPELAYPTYDIGARLAGAQPVPGAVADLSGLSGVSGVSGSVRLAWVNSPGNPTGEVASAGALAAAVTAARGAGAVLASDECYIGLGWEAEPVSVLHPDACGGSHEGLLAVHSLSKRSNLAGYRAGFVTGDPGLVAGLLEIRKHAGMIVPGPVQAAMTAALSDDAHARQQRERYAARRAALRPALEAAGWQVTHSQAGLYLWAAHPDYDGRGSVAVLAGAGILVAPGEFYGVSGAGHIRVALTATDERIDAAVKRLAALEG
jgi:succinyldiaminopimelate transaminase